MPNGGGGGGSVSGWPSTWFVNLRADTAFSLDGANIVLTCGFVLYTPFRLTQIGVYIATADAAHNYDFGIYSPAGALVANIGAQTLPNTGAQQLNTVQGVKTLAPGRYVFAWTGNDATAQTYKTGGEASWLYGNSATASAGGALPSTIAAPTEAFDPTALYFWLKG